MKKSICFILLFVFVVVLATGCSKQSNEGVEQNADRAVNSQVTDDSVSESESLTYQIKGISNCYCDDTITITPEQIEKISSKDGDETTKFIVEFTCPRCYDKESYLIDFPVEAYGKESYILSDTMMCTSSEYDGGDSTWDTCYMTNFGYNYSIQFQLVS